MAPDQRGGHPLVRNGVQNTHGLRRGKSQIERRDLDRLLAERPAGARVSSRHQHRQLAILDRPAQPELGSAPAQPSTR